MKSFLLFFMACALYAQDLGFTIYPSATTGAALQTAISSVPSTGGTVWVPRGTYAFGSTTVSVPVSNHKTLIMCEPGAVFTYTGTGVAFQVGDSTNTTENFEMRNCEISLDGNNNTNTVALKLSRTFWGVLDHVRIRGTLGYQGTPIQKGISLSGGNDNSEFCAYNTLRDVNILGPFKRGVHILSEVSPDPDHRDKCNSNLIIGGSIYNSASTKTGSIGVYVEHGDTNRVIGVDFDSWEKAVVIEGHNNYASIRCENNTTYCVEVTSNSQGSFIEASGIPAGQFLDNGYETQYIITSQGGVNKSMLSDLHARYGLTLVPQATAPATLTDGMIWYDSTAGRFKCRQAGSTVNCTP